MREGFRVGLMVYILFILMAKIMRMPYYDTILTLYFTTCLRRPSVYLYLSYDAVAPFSYNRFFFFPLKSVCYCSLPGLCPFRM